MSLENKRLDSLARNRASAELKLRHSEEWEEIRAKILHELQVEYAVMGIEPPRDRNTPRHVAEDGICVACGKPEPCQTMRRRAREKVRRIQTPVPKDFS